MKTLLRNFGYFILSGFAIVVIALGHESADATNNSTETAGADSQAEKTQGITRTAYLELKK